MNISNLKVTSKTKLAAVILSGTLAITGLTGCDTVKSQRQTALSGSIFDGAVVLTFEDGTKDIATEECYTSADGDVEYYRSLVTNLTYATPVQLQENPDTKGYVNTCLYVKEIEPYIADYLSDDELIKIYNDELSKPEREKIFERILNSSKEKTRKINK